MKVDFEKGLLEIVAISGNFYLGEQHTDPNFDRKINEGGKPMRVQTGSEFSLKNLSTSRALKSKLIKNLPTTVVEREEHDTGRMKKVEILVDGLEHTSAQSPIGRKVRNKEIGDEFEVVVDGHKIKYEIIAIS